MVLVKQEDMPDFEEWKNSDEEKDENETKEQKKEKSSKYVELFKCNPAALKKIKEAIEDMME